MKRVQWYNKNRLHGAIEYQTPNEKQNAFRQQKNKLEKAAQVLNKKLSGKPGVIHSECLLLTFNVFPIRQIHGG